MADQTLAILMASRQQIAQNIATLTASPAIDYTENGRTMSKASALGMLFQNLENLDNAIARAGGPFEVQSQAGGGGCWP